jgi:hypothetical protein
MIRYLSGRARSRSAAVALVAAAAIALPSSAFSGPQAGAASAPGQSPASSSEAGSPAAVGSDRDPALVLAEGSVARRQMVAIGRDLEVRGEALADAVAFDGSVAVTGRVAGDVVVLGGDARLAPTARVGGDVYVLGGTLEAAPGAVIGGRSVSYPDASAAWLTLIEGPALGLSAASPLVVAGKLALLAAWLALVIAFFATSGREVLSTSRGVSEQPLRSFATGVVGVLALLLTALLFTAFAAALVGVPLLVLAVILAVVLKLWGMVAVFHALGDWLARRFGRRPRALHAATLGLAVLGLIKLVPYLGIWVWTAATFIGVGAALDTKLGRREPWFEAGSV